MLSGLVADNPHKHVIQRACVWNSPLKVNKDLKLLKTCLNLRELKLPWLARLLACPETVCSLREIQTSGSYRGKLDEMWMRDLLSPLPCIEKTMQRPKADLPKTWKILQQHLNTEQTHLGIHWKYSDSYEDLILILMNAKLVSLLTCICQCPSYRRNISSWLSAGLGWALGDSEVTEEHIVSCNPSLIYLSVPCRGGGVYFVWKMTVPIQTYFFLSQIILAQAKSAAEGIGGCGNSKLQLIWAP